MTTTLHPPLHVPIPTGTILPPSVIPSKSNKKGMKLLQMTNRLRKSSSKSLPVVTSSSSTENYDYIVEFEHVHHNHCQHATFPTSLSTTTTTTASIPPFRIIPPSPETSTAANTKVALNHLHSSASRTCRCHEDGIGGRRRFRFLRTSLRKSSTSSPPLSPQRWLVPRKRRILPSHNTSSLSTLQTFNTTGSSSSSCTNGVEEDPTNECTGPINEYGDCRKLDIDLDFVVDDDGTLSNSSTTAMSTAQMMMDMSDQYYCIGKYYQYELCQSLLALQYYYNAYHTAMQCYRNVMSSSQSENIATTPSTATAHRHTQKNIDIDAMVSPTSPHVSSSFIEEIQGQIQLTKECIGRIHFELGNIDEALQML